MGAPTLSTGSTSDAIGIGSQGDNVQTFHETARWGAKPSRHRSSSCNSRLARSWLGRSEVYASFAFVGNDEPAAEPAIGLSFESERIRSVSGTRATGLRESRSAAPPRRAREGNTSSDRWYLPAVGILQMSDLHVGLGPLPPDC
jgi:hypothetical protein